MGVVITNLIFSKKTVNVGERFKVQVAVKETFTEPRMYRLPFNLGKEKGGIK